MKKILHFFLLLISFYSFSQGVGIGTKNPDTSSILDVKSKDKGVLISRMTQSARDSIVKPANGLMVYCTTCNSNEGCLSINYGTPVAPKWDCATMTPKTAQVASIDCSSYYMTPATINANVYYTGLVLVSYDGGNGASYPSQIITSTGVTGLTAIIGSGTLNYNGQLAIQISGTPSGVGNAVFDYTFGGQSCSLLIPVNVAPSVGAITGCGTVSGVTESNGASINLVGGKAVPPGAKITVPYTGGNGGSYAAQTLTSSTVNGLTLNLSAGTLKTGDGNFVFEISGTPNTVTTNGIATFNFLIGNYICVIQVEVTTGGPAVSGITCGSATISSPIIYNTNYTTGTLTLTVPYTGGNGVGYPAGSNILSADVVGLKAVLKEGTLNNGAGNLVYDVTGTANATGIANFTLSFGGKTCTVSFPVNAAPIPASITLGAADFYIASVYDATYNPVINVQGSLTTTPQTVNIPYTVTGTSVTLPAYNQTITILKEFTTNGTPNTVGAQNIDIRLSYGSQTLAVGTGFITAQVQAVSATLNAKQEPVSLASATPPYNEIGKFSYPSSGTNLQYMGVRVIPGIPDRNFADANHKFLYLPITSSKTGKTWLNNNLGAGYAKVGGAYFNPTQQAMAVTDYKAYGSLYQWGRYSDGHELINWDSATAGTPLNGSTFTLSTTDTPANSLFILNWNSPFDWRSTRNSNLWQGVSGTNNPCPLGYRVPTIEELEAELTESTGNTDVPNAATLPHFPYTGYRDDIGGLRSSDTLGDYWSSKTDGVYSYDRFFRIYGADSNGHTRSLGFCVRCIKD